MTTIVVLYYSRDGSTRRMANQIARGITSVEGCEYLLRSVPEIITTDKATDTNTEQADALMITKDELRNADGLIVGSPTRFGNMACLLYTSDAADE